MMSEILRLPEGDEAGGGGLEDASDINALKAELAAERSAAQEARQSAQYWHDQVKGGASKTVDTPTAADTDEEVDPIELISRKGAKGLDELLTKRGYVRADDVDARVNAKAQQIATENQLAADYPELKDTTSEFFKATAVHYKGMIEAGVNPTIAMKLAAQQTELDGYKSGKRLSPTEKAEREARAKAASGEGKGKNSNAVDEDQAGEGELDAFQQYMLDQFEITPEAYRARAKAGVNVGGKR